MERKRRALALELKTVMERSTVLFPKELERRKTLFVEASSWPRKFPLGFTLGLSWLEVHRLVESRGLADALSSLLRRVGYYAAEPFDRHLIIKGQTSHRR